MGFGTIARELARRLIDEGGGASPRLAAVLSARAFARADAQRLPEGLEAVFGDAEGLLGWAPDLIVECAGHAGVRAHVARCLERGVDVILVSVGALADAALAARLQRSAERGRARLLLPAGAIGGLDLLGALAKGDIESVRYRGVKPPGAWRGSPAERAVDLGALEAPTAFFEGDARRAARDYPANANVAATLALHGLGFERTEVTLVADPGAAANTHEIEVRASSGDFSLRVAGRPSAGNARTSLTTVLSILHEIDRWRGGRGDALP